MIPEAQIIQVKEGRSWATIAGPFFTGLLSGRNAEAELQEFQQAWPNSTFRIKRVREIDKPVVELGMVYAGGSIQYFAGHPLPQITVALYQSTTLGQFWDALINELFLTSELFDKYETWELNRALYYFYQENIQGRRKEAFVKFNREETDEIQEEGSAYVFVFGRLEIGGPLHSSYLAYP